VEKDPDYGMYVKKSTKNTVKFGLNENLPKLLIIGLFLCFFVFFVPMIWQHTSVVANILGWLGSVMCLSFIFWISQEQYWKK
jgi:hypothetical protein